MTYSIFLAIILIVVSTSFVLICKLYSIDFNKSVELLLFTLILSFIFSRLAFVLANYNYYVYEIAKPQEMLYFWYGGFSMAGIVIGSLISTLIYSRIHGQRGWIYYDVISLPLILFISLERLLEPLVNLGLGKTLRANTFVNSIFVEKINNIAYHRVYVYEFVFGIALSLFLIFYIFKHKNKKSVFLLAMGLFLPVQIIFESLRNDSHMLSGFIKVQALLYLVVLVILALFSTYPLKSKLRKLSSLVLVLLLICLIIFMEFQVDASNNILRDYIIMLLSGAGISFIMLYNYKKRFE